jgi:hypothetical protein
MHTAEGLAAGALDEALVRASVVAADRASGPVSLGVGALELRVLILTRRGGHRQARLGSRRHDGKRRQAHGHQQAAAA